MNSTRFGKGSWKEFTVDDLETIRKEREDHRDKIAALREQFPKAQYGVVCRACTKPNTLSIQYCTGCGFPCTQDDVQKLPDNIFLDIINGTVEHGVIFRDDKYLIFNDKFPVSENHLMVIPIEVIDDITHLNASHIPLIEHLYEIGLQELQSRNLELYKGKHLEEYLVTGFNFPVSVKHLHLHVLLPPFKHSKVFIYPRWHSYAKVLSDLKKHGRVIVYPEQPNDEEGENEHKRALRLHNAVTTGEKFPI